MASIAINDALEDLSDDDFKKFCHRLLARTETPKVKRNKVEGKSRLDVAELLVSTFTEAGARQVCVKILKSIGCNNEAESLVQNTDEPAAGEADEPASAATDVTDGKHFVDKHQAPLTQRVTNTFLILDDLLGAAVIQYECYDTIMSLKTNQERMEALYSTALKSSGKEGKDRFLTLLEKHEPHLIAELRK